VPCDEVARAAAAVGGEEHEKAVLGRPEA
jgi:hypothetical protein